MIELGVVVTGGEPKSPNTIKCSGRVSKALVKQLPNLSADRPLLIHAQVGAGKTWAIVHELLPWALATNRRVIYVSSRAANNVQIKREIIKVTGESNIIKEHTSYGLARQKDFKGISVVTYHKLYSMMLYESEELRTFDVLVFDEVHALLEDALYVPYTGYILRHIKEHFGAKLRIYMSGTPEEMLPLLAKAEAPYQLTVLKFAKNFSYVRVRFFKDEADLVRCIGESRDKEKWLIYTPSISHGEKLKESLTCNCQLLNSATRKDDLTGWDEMLDKREFKASVAIATSVVDVGVSFEDQELRNVAVFSTNLITIIQFLGRKRCKHGETVNLYIHCPTKQDLAKKLCDGKRMLAQLALFYSNHAFFMEHHVLHPDRDDLRRFVRSGWGGEVYLNDLAKVKLENELSFHESLLLKGRGEDEFERQVIRMLGLRSVDVNACRMVARSQTELEVFLEQSAEKEMDVQAFGVFADRFRDLCVQAYGTGKGGRDRKDRCWHEDKIRKKLLELESQFELHVDQVNGVYVLRDTVSDLLVAREEKGESFDGKQ